MVSGGDADPELSADARRQVARWLFGVCIGIVILVVFGGWVRLTHSGLSMTDWRPVTGFLPPLTEAAWDAAFRAYANTPEYRLINTGMALADYKFIYWMEYTHRLMGRLVGLAFVVPLVVFLVRGILPPRRLLPFAVVGVLFALQGLLGWLMVKSGLVDVPQVSPYRLAAHLLLALLLLVACQWLALSYWFGPEGADGNAAAALRGPAWLFLGLLVAQIGSGTLMAGLKAGWVSAAFPKMMGQWVPAGLLSQEPWFRNLFENQLTVHFQHRWLAFAVLAAAALLAYRGRGLELPERRRLALASAPYAVAAQLFIGIGVVVMSVPVGLASLHQAAGVAALLLAVFVCQQISSR